MMPPGESPGATPVESTAAQRQRGYEHHQRWRGFRGLAFRLDRMRHGCHHRGVGPALREHALGDRVHTCCGIHRRHQLDVQLPLHPSSFFRQKDEKPRVGYREITLDLAEAGTGPSPACHRRGFDEWKEDGRKCY